MQLTMLFVLELQFEAAIQVLYKESGTIISLDADVLMNALTLESVGTEVACLKSKTMQLLQLQNAYSPMLVTESGIVTLVSSLQS